MSDETDPSKAKPSDRAYGWFKRQVLNWQFVGWLAAAVLAIYIFYAGREAPEVSFQISVVQVFNVESSSQAISLRDFGGKRIESNVYAAEIVLWNSGDAPVDKSGIRKPIKIKTMDGAGILDYEFLGEIEAGVSKFRVGEASLDEPTSRLSGLEAVRLLKEGKYLDAPYTLSELDVDWQHFDDGHGFRIRVIFMAEQASDLTVVGNVYPSGAVIDRTTGATSPKTARPIWFKVLGIIFYGVFFIGLVLIVNITIFQFIDGRLRKKSVLVVWVLYTPVVLSSMYLMFLASPIFLGIIRTMASPPL